MCKIIITKTGHQIMIDEEDWDKIKHLTWYVTHAPHSDYALGQEKGSRKVKRKIHLMHRLIMDAPKGMDIDHIDGNGLNNQKKNLRICTRSQNLGNTKSRAGTSIYKGVSLQSATGKWYATIGARKKQYFLGLFTNEAEAAIAYNKKAEELFGEFAQLNIIQ